MGEFDTTDIEVELATVGELMVVLDSDREYELHLHDTEFNEQAGTITTEGMIDGEYQIVTFPTSAVEHYYVHKES